MAVYKYKKLLLAVTSPVNSNQTGSKHVVLEGNHGDAELAFKVWFDLTQAGGVTSPTVKAKLQTSHDGVSWADVVESTQLAADGALSEWKLATDIGPFVRVVTVLGGATLPNHTAAVYLMSHNHFNTKTVS